MTRRSIINLQQGKTATYILGKKINEELICRFGSHPGVLAFKHSPSNRPGTGSVKVIDANSGACSLIRSSINYFVISDFCSPDMMAIHVIIP